MRPLGLALAIVLGATLVSSLVPSRAAAASAPSISKDERAKGMAAAPALISAAGADCQLADARFIGQNKDPKTKTTSDFYEVACTGNEGLIFDKSDDQPPSVFTCAETSVPQPNGKPNNLACILPGNLDPKAGLEPYIAKSGVACTPTKLRPIGHNAQLSVFEIACQNGQGFVLQTSSPPKRTEPAKMIPCIGIPEGANISCTLTTRESQLAMVDQLVAQSGKPCVVKDRRYIGAATATGDMYYEVACQDGKGYVLETTPNGGFKQAIDCAGAEGIGGGCTLTNAREAETAQAGLYSQLAAKAGFNCSVSKYAPLPANVAGKEVVELVCSNRPDGAIAMFPTTGTQAAEIYDCAHSELKGFRCAFTPPSAAYPKLTAELRAQGKTSCVVSNSRIVGIAADKGYIETACADGLPGYMIRYRLTPLTAEAAVPCSEASGIGGGCQLPGNSKRTG
ncbi:MAG TPA: hypothetical protein VGS12_06615 [Caulobacteraceae bacterium]|nr:hypothetical protein [Caulobacteraceae bacterium]